MQRLVLKRQRVELGKQMAADAVSADQHHRAQGIQRGRTHRFCIDLLAATMAFGNSLYRTVRVHSTDDTAAGLPPAGARLAINIAQGVKLVEIGGPATVDGPRVLTPGGIHFRNEGGICRREKAQVQFTLSGGFIPVRPLRRIIHRNTTPQYHIARSHKAEPVLAKPV